MQFPFQEIYIKSTHNSALRSFVSKGSACNIRTWSGKTSEDGRSRIRTWVYGSIRSTEVLMVSRSEALQGQKIRRCYALSCLTLMIFKRCIHKHQIRRKYTWQATLTDKRNVKSY